MQGPAGDRGQGAGGRGSLCRGPLGTGGRGSLCRGPLGTGRQGAGGRAEPV